MNITPELLAKSFIKYRKELLALVTIGLQDSLKHMSLRTGIRYKEVVGELTGEMEIGPYSATRVASADTAIKGRVLETFLGSVVKPFEPNSIVQSIYGDSRTKGEALKDIDIVRRVAAYLVAKLSNSLNRHIFDAERDDDGTRTVDLFNGFDTITAAEITAGNIAVANGNMFNLDLSTLTSVNVGDKLMEAYFSADDELQGQDTKMYLSRSIYNKYNEWYRNNFGSVPYNTEYKKTFLEGTDRSCELVPLVGKKASDFIQLTTRQNMLVGVDQMSDTERLEVAESKTSHFVLDFIATLFFGTQFESISKERLLIIGDDGSTTAGGGTTTGGSDNAGGSDNSGDTDTHTYTPVDDTAGKNPASEGWYERVGESEPYTYELTDDTEPQQDVTYYVQS